jgi:hypothetical protein
MEEISKNNETAKLGIGDVIGGFNIDKMKTIVPYYIVDMGEIQCNELRFIIETFLSQNHDFKNKVDELKNLL